MWSDAFAQAAGAAGAAKPADPRLALLLQILQFVPIFVIIYLLLIRPQRQRQKKLDDLVKKLKKGDRVLTTGGIIGTVVGVDDTKAVLRISDEVKVEFAKSAVVQVLEEAK
jgi:preprotein translocase subunit YajC